MKELSKYFVPYNRAKKLEKLGFDWDCMGWYISQENILAFGNAKKNCLLKELSVLAPTFSQAFDWFRENYWLDYSIKPSKVNELKKYCFNLFEEEDIIFPTNRENSKYFDTREEAELACLDKLIEIAEKL